MKPGPGLTPEQMAEYFDAQAARHDGLAARSRRKESADLEAHRLRMSRFYREVAATLRLSQSQPRS